jgi:peptidoglycan/xylan/chitin deacetylase (PgdA/CDA1 family)
MASKAQGNGLRCVLAYHEIQRSASKYLYRVTNARFDEHLSLISGLAKSNSPAQVPVITFDDGHRSNYEQAFPLLEKHAVKATFFVVPGRTGTDRELMSWEQLRDLVAAGHRVQSHGWAHRLLTLCDDGDLQKEIVSSKRELEDRMGAEVQAISAPGGRWNDRVVKACAEAGYKQFFHSNPWVPERNHLGLQLQGRHMVTGRIGPQEVASLLELSRSRVLFQRAKYRAKEQVRLTLGDSLYQKLWMRLTGWSTEEGMEVDVTERRNGAGGMQHS